MRGFLSQFRKLTTRALRSNETLAERRFRRGLSYVRANNSHFRRQVAIGPYIVDFACHGEKIVVEIDGDTHGQEIQRRRDQKRDRYLTSRGYRVLRFWNNDVIENLDACIERVQLAIDAKKEAPTSPLAGEVGALRGAPGGGPSKNASLLPPLPGGCAADPPRQGEGFNPAQPAQPTRERQSIDNCGGGNA